LIEESLHSEKFVVLNTHRHLDQSVHFFCISKCSKGKEEYLYSTFYYASKRSDMDHTVYLQITPWLSFLRKHSPDGATPKWGSRHPVAAYYSSIDPKGMKGWVGLRPIVDGLPT